MSDDWEGGDDGEQIIGLGFRDSLTNMLAGVFSLFLFALVLISPPKDENAASEPPGTMEVKIQWTNGPIDVDLWTYSTGEERPVGFSRTSGKVWSLVRDDLGISNDDPDFPANIENSYARTAKAGHYVFNVVCYRCDKFPVKVKLEIRATNMGGQSSSHVLLETTVELIKPLQEITVVAFDLSDKGGIVNGSVNNVFKPLSQAWSG